MRQDQYFFQGKKGEQKFPNYKCGFIICLKNMTLEMRVNEVNKK